jgi:hypothetical protein
VKVGGLVILSISVPWSIVPRALTRFVRTWIFLIERTPFYMVKESVKLESRSSIT